MPKPKAPLLPKSTDDVDASAAKRINEAVARNVDIGPVGKWHGKYFEYNDELRTKIAKHACLHGDRSAARFASFHKNSAAMSLHRRCRQF